MEILACWAEADGYFCAILSCFIPTCQPCCAWRQTRALALGSQAGMGEELCLGTCCTLSWADELLTCVMWRWEAEHVSLLLLPVC